jgi:hypothetical protein
MFNTTISRFGQLAGATNTLDTLANIQKIFSIWYTSQKYLLSFSSTQDGNLNKIKSDIQTEYNSVQKLSDADITAYLVKKNKNVVNKTTVTEQFLQLFYISTSNLYNTFYTTLIQNTPYVSVDFSKFDSIISIYGLTNTYKNPDGTPARRFPYLNKVGTTVQHNKENKTVWKIVKNNDNTYTIQTSDGFYLDTTLNLTKISMNKSWVFKEVPEQLKTYYISPSNDLKKFMGVGWSGENVMLFDQKDFGIFRSALIWKFETVPKTTEPIVTETKIENPSLINAKVATQINLGGFNSLSPTPDVNNYVPSPAPDTSVLKALSNIPSADTMLLKQESVLSSTNKTILIVAAVAVIGGVLFFMFKSGAVASAFGKRRRRR